MNKKLSRDGSIILTVGILVMAGLVIASTFVNVYLIRLTNDMGLMILSNIVNYATLLSGFIIGTRYVKKGSMLTLLRAGLVANMVYYLLILILKENTGKYLLLLGAFNGLGQGFYYFSFNLLVGKLTKEDERSKFFSYQSSFSYIFGVLAPTVSGYIIVQFSQLTGYYVLFAASLCVFILAIVFSFKLNSVHVDEEYHVMGVLKLKNNKYWDTNKYFNFSFGLREALYAQFFVVFCYLLVSDEQIIGNLNSMMSLIAVGSSLLIASKFTLQTQRRYHLYFAIGYAISLGTLAIVAKPWCLYLTYALNGVILCWNSVIYQNMKYQLSSRAHGGFNQGDYIICCEFPMAAGRLSGLFIFFVLNKFFGGFNLYRFLLIAIVLIAFFDHVVIAKKINWLEDEEN